MEKLIDYLVEKVYPFLAAILIIALVFCIYMIGYTKGKVDASKDFEILIEDLFYDDEEE